MRLADEMMWRIQNPHFKLKPKEHKRWIVRINDAAQHAETTNPGFLTGVHSKRVDEVIGS